MYTVQTYILRLLADPAEPGTLRGTLRSALGGAAHHFGDEHTLLALLRSLVCQPAGGMQEDRPDGADPEETL